MVGSRRLELPTSSVSRKRSNQLSYEPTKAGTTSIPIVARSLLPIADTCRRREASRPGGLLGSSARLNLPAGLGALQRALLLPATGALSSAMLLMLFLHVLDFGHLFIFALAAGGVFPARFL